MKRTPPPPMNTVKFIFVAMVCMVLMDYFVFGSTRSYIEDARKAYRESHQEKPDDSPPPVRVSPPGGAEFFERVPSESPAGVYPGVTDAPLSSPSPEPSPLGEKAYEEEGEDLKPDGEAQHESKAILPKPAIGGRPKIAIIIDDLGMDVKRSREVVNLPAGVTLAFLPYALKTPELAREGKAKGHSLIIHTPMEAMDSSQNIGPGGLKTGMSDAQFDAAFEKMLASFDGYEGINNHMGSRLTQDPQKMDRIMAALAKRGLFFVDSKTVGSSVAADEAAANDVKFAERDVFIDHVDSAAFVQNALLNVERTARRKGYAIAIGHPKDHTIAGLRAWIPTLEEKGFELVPVKRLLVSPKPSATVEARGKAKPVEKVLAKSKAVEKPQVKEPAAVIYDMSGAPIMDPALDMFPEETIPTLVPSAGGGAGEAPAFQIHPMSTEQR